MSAWCWRRLATHGSERHLFPVAGSSLTSVGVPRSCTAPSYRMRPAYQPPASPHPWTGQANLAAQGAARKSQKMNGPREFRRTIIGRAFTHTSRIPYAPLHGDEDITSTTRCQAAACLPPSCLCVFIQRHKHTLSLVLDAQDRCARHDGLLRPFSSPSRCSDGRVTRPRWAGGGVT